MDISAIEGTATHGSDFVAAPATLLFSSHDKITSQCKMIEITDDLVLENNEYFTLQLSTSNERVVLPPTKDVIINDDECKYISHIASSYMR